MPFISSFAIVMELMSGGDLFDRIGKNKKYNEEDARSLCKKMIESLCFCHENSVVCIILLYKKNSTVSFKICLLTKHPMVLPRQLYESGTS